MSRKLSSPILKTHTRNVLVEVTPGARNERIVESLEGFLVRVKEKAAGNRANERVREIVALHFGVPCTAVRIVRGHTSRRKVLNVIMRS